VAIKNEHSRQVQSTGESYHGQSFHHKVEEF